MIYKELFDWQQEIIDRFEDRKAFGLFLDMGLGKTPLSLAFAEAHNSNKIIIVSKNKKVLETVDTKWSFAWWLTKANIKYNIYNKNYNFRGEGVKKRQITLSPESNDVLLINYEGLYKFGAGKKSEKKKGIKSSILSDIVSDFVASCRNETVTVILDESHKVKEPTSLQTMAVCEIKQLLEKQKNNVYMYLLTGTPFTKGYIDLFSQLKLLGWEKSKTFFYDQFCIRAQVYSLYAWQQPIASYKNVDQLYRVIHRFAITIKSEEVVDLPEQIFVNHDMPDSLDLIMFSLEKMKKEDIESYARDKGIELPYDLGEAPRGGRVNNPFYRNIAFPDPKWTAETSAIFYLRARQLSIGFQGNDEEYFWYDKSRLNALKELLEEHPDNYVLFYNFEPEFYEIFNLCDELGYNVDVWNGNIKSEYFYQRYLNMTPGERLTESKNIILANTVSGAEGGNWQGYNKCILFSVPLFGAYAQAIKRIHRIGAEGSSVIYHTFFGKNWLDTKMLEALKQSKEYDLNLFKSDLKRIQEIFSKGKESDI